MRKLILIAVLLCCVNLSANESFSYLMGMRNNRYVFAGVEYAARFGIAVENSVFTQGTEKQYIRVAPYYRWNLGEGLVGSYALYTGMRYDRDYYDIGARLDVLWQHYRYLQVGGTLMPFYDSSLKGLVGYQAYVQSFLLKEIGVFAGAKNLPDFRNEERRFMGGLVFESGNLCVRPEVSVPMNGGTHLSRVSLFFVYRSP